MHPFRDQSNSPSINRVFKGLSISQNKTPGSAGRLHRQAQTSNTTFGLNNTRRGLLEKKPTKREITPTRNSSVFRGGDRFHPTRMSEDFLDEANHLFTNNKARFTNNQIKFRVSAKSTSNLMRSDAKADEKIFCYKPNQAPVSRTGQINQARVLYTVHTLNPSSSVKKTYRYINTEVVKTLDAPQLNPDVYMQLLDWSATGILAVALDKNIYIWDQFTGESELLVGNEDEEDHRPMTEVITALRWSLDGRVLAVGYFDGTLKIFDPNKRNAQGVCKELRKMIVPNVSRLGALVWRREGVVSAGYMGGQIVHFDVAKPNPVIGTWLTNGHRRDITGMDWDPRFKKLATSSGDWTINVWDEQQIKMSNPTPLYTLTDHTSQVRCVKWCPFKTEVLASGGGKQDGTVKLWSIQDCGKCIKSVAINSGVSSIVFNSPYKEMLVSTDEGYMKLYSYGTFKEQANIAAHPTYQILRMVESGCGEFVFTSSSDEMLKMWHLFKVDKSLDKLNERRKNPYSTALR
ncbi:hypothetical protein WR25_16832 [Diploscapter pachys]|uniref:CDC20/Fizzy WD40 domain-containing protein n=1 Tax=Diploscapter pachys TaxID=2018661 RepID=A0A2A2LYL5_9BILA|nr:hypothetical protein WR25_16832 [Diploscapter pachys]